MPINPTDIRQAGPMDDKRAQVTEDQVLAVLAEVRDPDPHLI